MNAKEFFDKVRSMREAQRRYFKYRTSDELSRARILEKEVDAEILRVDKLMNRTITSAYPTLPNLFDDLEK